MNPRLFFLLSVLLAGAAPVGAALQFNTSQTPLGGGRLLSAVTYDNVNAFVIVGTNSPVALKLSYTDGAFAGSANNVAATASLRAVSYGAGQYLAGSTNAAVYRSTDGVIWTVADPAFQSSAEVGALVFNPLAGAGSGRFVAAAKLPTIRWTEAASVNWQNSTLSSPVRLLEAFKAATSFGDDSFAVAGDGGVVRVSDNSGQTWAVRHPFNVGDKNLFGIASDEVNRLVVVGADGRVLVSNNRGTSWTTNTPASGDLNAVAYTGNQYIAVGAGGVILTSADGTVWQVQGSPVNVPLNGVIAASTGNLKGLSVIVGANGTILLAAEPPTAQVSGSTTICDGASTVIHADLTGTPPWNVTWSDGLTQSDVLASPAVRTVSPANGNPNAPTLVEYLVTNLTDANNSFDSAIFPGNLTGSALITINPRPRTVVSGSATICNGSATEIQAALTGIAPWTVTWSDGFVQTTNASPAVRTVSPANAFPNSISNVTYTVTGLVDANACALQAGDLSGSALITINPRPMAVVSGSRVICNGSATDIGAALTGTGPWTVTWSDGFVQTTNASPAVRTVNPANQFPNSVSNVTYTVTGLVDANACALQAGDLSGSAVITVNPRPKAVVSGNATICNGSSTNIQAALSGTAPWSVTWSDGFVQTTNASPAVRTVNPANQFPNSVSNVTYTVTGLVDANACALQTGDLSGSAMITINPRPKAVVSGNATICNGSSTNIQAVLSGMGPWSVTWSDGFVQTTNATPAVRTVNPANQFPNSVSNVTYTVTGLVDANACALQAGDLSGSAMITINPRPKAVVSGNATICNGSSTNIQAVLSGMGPWSVTWSDGFAQTTNASPAVRTVNPANQFPNSVSNVTYTVTGLVDANACALQAGDLSGSAMITINPRPKAVVSGNATICNGSSTNIQAALSGMGPWSVTWSDGFAQTTNASPAVRTVNPANQFPNSVSNVTYTVTGLADANACAVQAGDLSGSAMITINPRPKAVVSGTATICNGSSTNIQAVLSGMGPWSVTWSDGFVQTTNASPAVRTVNPANQFPNSVSNVTYTVTGLADANACAVQAGDLSGSAMITINPRPKAVVSGNATICNGSSTNIQAVLSGMGPWSVTWSDGFAQTTNASPAVRTVNPANQFPNSVSNVTYTVTGLVDANACALQAGDLSGSAMITINPRPKAVVSGNATICNGSSTNIQAALSGMGPWSVTWSDGFAQTTNGSPAVRTVNPANQFPNSVSNVTYTVTGLVDANACALQAGDLSGSAMITINPRPKAVVSGNATICNGSSTNIQAALSGMGPWSVTWSDGFAQTTNGSPAVRTVNPANLSPNSTSNVTYTVTGLVDANACALQAGDLSGSAMITINASPTATLADTSASICDGDETQLLVDLTGIAPWTVAWSDGVVQTNIISDTLLRTITGVHTGSGPMTNVYTLVSVSDINCSALSAGIAGSAVVVVNSHPLPPTNGMGATNCVGSPTPALEVQVETGVTVDWYDETGTNLLQAGTLNYTPTNTAAGSYVFRAVARNLATGCLSTNYTDVPLLLENCSQSMGIMQQGTNVIISWVGNFQLQSTALLTNPPSMSIWAPVTSGMPGVTNYWTNPVVGDQTFFRLYAPTN